MHTYKDEDRFSARSVSYKSYIAEVNLVSAFYCYCHSTCFVTFARWRSGRPLLLKCVIIIVIVLWVLCKQSRQRVQNTKYLQWDQYVDMCYRGLAWRARCVCSYKLCIEICTQSSKVYLISLDSIFDGCWHTFLRLFFSLYFLYVCLATASVPYNDFVLPFLLLGFILV